MHVEIQVALNFFISFLYNKLPRRRVNQFGEELEKALKIKFIGHWYPEKPFKGSAFRCLKTALPLDPIFEIAAVEAGMAIADIQENLPEELSIWIDPGEVSYRLGEKGCVKILFSESEEDREVVRTFNPEAQCFRPIDSLASQLAALALPSPSPPATSASLSPSPPPVTTPFLPNKTNVPLTFTTASFAQTKFGSTKLKSNGKRSHRMSPTEFSSYIKQRAIIQQQQQQLSPLPNSLFGGRPRSLSPAPPLDAYLPFPPYELGRPSPPGIFMESAPSPVASQAAAAYKAQADAANKGYDGFNMAGVNYSSQHLLMAN